MPISRRRLAGLGIALLAVAATAAVVAAHLWAAPQTGAGTGNGLVVVAAPSSPPGTELSVIAAHLSLVVNSTPKITTVGAIGTNKTAFHSIGFQRPFSNDLEVALAKKDATGLSDAVTALEYTFAHQNPVGSFQVVQVPGAAYSLNTDPIVGDVFFYADLGHALELLQQSPWYTTSSATASMRGRVEALRAKIALGLHWLAEPAELPTVKSTGTNDTNRAIYGAEAFLLTGEWLDDSSAIGIGEGLLHSAEGNLQPDGTILEKGGFDSGYQSVSLDNLFRIYLNVSDSLASLKAPLWNMITKGLARELQAIEPTGEVSHANNSRTYCGGENFRGKPKQGGGNDVTRVLVYYSALSGQTSLLSTAESVRTFYTTNTHSLCALPT